MPFAVGPTLRCARCLELHHELERIRVIALRRGIIEGLTPGANPAPSNVDAEFRLWLTVNPKPTIAQAWRGGWDRAFAIARAKLKDVEQARLRYVTEVSSLRSKIGVLIGELSRLTDNGGR